MKEIEQLNKDYEKLSLRHTELVTKVITLENRIKYQEKKSNEILLGQCFNIVANKVGPFSSEYNFKEGTMFLLIRGVRLSV